MIRRADHRDVGDLYDEMIVDNFAGGGGASMAIERALGRAVDVAINHDREAVSMHRANHPATHHLCQDVWEVDPREVTGGRPVGLGWFSPDCTHFSKARGGKPTRDAQRKSRDLAWVVIRWAKLVRPRVIMLENVEEFVTWGPLTDDGRPCPKRRGHTFRSWTKQLRDLGYAVEWKELRACDYGAPTIRRRLFLVARCDGQPIKWPEATHGAGRKAVRECSEAGDLGEAGLSVDAATTLRDGVHQGKCHDRSSRTRRGDRTTEAGDGSARRVGGRLKPYRTAAECIDWSIPCPSIFDRKRPLAENTMKRIAAGIKRYVLDAAEPFIVGAGGPRYGGKPQSIRKPMGTQTTENHRALVCPTLVQTGYGEREGQQPRVPGLHKPLGTVVGGGCKHALVSAFLGSIANYGGNGSNARPADAPLSTVTAWPRGGHHAVTAAHMIKLRGTCRDGQDLREPGPTLTASGTHAGLVAALLVKYYGNDRDGQGVNEPMHTIPTVDRFGLVTVQINGEPHVITDIGMRMCQPGELYLAQGFPPTYIHDWGIDENGERIRLTKTAQVRMCGNSVSPPPAEQLIAANLVEQAEEVAA